MKSPKKFAKKTWQRIAKNLPLRHAPFAELFPIGASAATGALQISPGFSGELLAEPGTPYFIHATRFADGKAGSLGGEDRDYVTVEPTRRLFAMAGAGIIGANGICYVPSTRTVVRETLNAWDAPLDQHPVFATPGLPAARPLPGVSLSLATLGGETFYHFLLESLPKLALARSLLPHIDQLLVPRYIEDAKTAWLRHFGFTQKIVWLQDLDHWQCEQLLFTNRLTRHFEPNPWCVRVLRQFAQVPERAIGSQALWLDRSTVANRNITWEREFTAALPELTVMDLGALQPAEVLSRCAGATTLAGLHGAAFANMVFTPPGATVIELMPKPFPPFYSRLAQACGHEHHAVRMTDTAAGRAAALAAIQRLTSKPR